MMSQETPTKADPKAGTALTPAALVGTALQEEETALAALLEGSGVSTMAFRQDVLLALAKAPKLAALARTPEGARSLVSAAVDAAQLGLRIGGSLGLAALVPFKGTVKLLVQYPGKIEIALRSGLVRSVSMGYACERDEFDFDEGSAPFVKHKKPLQGARGEIVAGYAIATMPEGAKVVRVVTSDEAMAARAKSAGYAYAVQQDAKHPDHPWATHAGEMWAKTAVHRLSKTLPTLPALQRLEAAGRVLVEADEPAGDAGADCIEAEIVDEPAPAPPAKEPPAKEPPAKEPAKKSTPPPVAPVAPAAPDDWQMTAEMWTKLVADVEAGGFKLSALAESLNVAPLPAKGSQVSQAQYEALRGYIDGEEIPF